MTIKKIYDILDEISPFELQESWDNSGLIVGNPRDKIEGIYISLDLDLEMLEEIPGRSLIITHHPLIFSPLKSINFDSYPTKLLQQLIKKDIALISMHTNIDKTHLNRYVSQEILGFEIIEQNDFVCYANVDMSIKELQEYVQKKLDLQYSKCVKCHEKISKIAITTGSGMSLLPYIKADCFLTGDIKYHDAMDAKIKGVSLIDIGHYESEKHFTPLMKDLLKKNLKKNQLKGIITVSKNPFSYK